VKRELTTAPQHFYLKKNVRKILNALIIVQAESKKNGVFFFMLGILM
jgi:hypothetical protein